jgi:hypothetical protein
VALGSFLPQLAQLRLRSHLRAQLVDGLPFFEMGVQLRIGCFWDLKPTFRQVSPEKRGTLALVSSFSLLGDASRLEIPSK